LSNSFAPCCRKNLPAPPSPFLPADIVSQILNFGLPAPIDVQITGPDREASFAYATDLLKRIRLAPGIADLHIQQAFDYPQLNVDVNRSFAGIVGLTQRDVANSLLITLSGSGQVRPNFWLNTTNGVSYPIVVQSPQYWMDSVSDLINLPITSPATKTPRLLGSLASITPGPSAAVVSHYNVQPVIDIYGAVQGRDLGAVSKELNRILDEAANKAPHGTHVAVRGQVQTMTGAYAELYFGLAGAIVLVYLIIVVNFQSWLDPFIIITALPGALAGIVWILFLTGTTLSIPALTGAIMCMGIATANSVLLVSFGRERLAQGFDAAAAAIDAGFTRFRPVLMTAGAMILGMIPMALAMGEGGEQNAPLGRAVIGGLLVATVATLFFVPGVFSVLHWRDRTLPPAGSSSSAPSAAPDV
jgi:multidrug efflux pump subunit AcrB